MKEIYIKRLIFIGITPIVFLILYYLGYSLINNSINFKHWTIDFRSGFVFSSLAILIIYILVIWIIWEDIY